MSIDVLIIAEKPSVARMFAEILSKNRYRIMYSYNVEYYVFKLNNEVWASIGLKGHILNYDYPSKYNRWAEVDPRDLFFIDPIQVIEKGSYRYVEALRDIGRSIRYALLALDADSEGESIAFETLKILEQINKYFEAKRLWFSAVTERDILQALNNPQEPNRLLAEKCFTRMIIDLTIGSAFTRILTLSVRKTLRNALPRGHFLSFGPCQTPTLWFVVQREIQREKFKAEKFYRITCVLKANGVVFEAEHHRGRINSREEAEEIYSKIKNALRAYTKSFKSSIKTKNPPKPLNTIEFESRVSKFLNIRSKTALDIAEKLYQHGYISYPRTETEIYGSTINLIEIVQMLSKNVDYNKYIEAQILKGFKPTRGGKDDKAHPPIHPTRIASKQVITEKFSGNAWKIYDFIARHFLATLSKPALIESQRLELEIEGEKFIAEGLRVARENYLEIYFYERISEKNIPKLNIGEEIEVLKIELKEGETLPPPYLSEAELIKLMEAKGIGTDATIQDHIYTNIKRGYFYIKNKRCIPTPLGIQLIKSLDNIIPEAVKPDVRAFIETQISQVAKGVKTRSEVVEFTRKIFLNYYDKLKENIDEVSKTLAPLVRKSIILTNTRKKSRGFKRARGDLNP